MRLLLSALSCNPAIGSEALVGYKYVEALARCHEVVVLASPPSQTPSGARLLNCDAGPCSFNEVGALPLLRFELRQLRMAHKLCGNFHFDLVHRITPSALGVPTWAGRLGRPLVVGPLIAANRPANCFAPYLNRPVSRPKEPRWHPARVLARLCKMLVNRASKNGNHLRQAARIFVGTRTAMGQIPDQWRQKCRLVTYSGVEHEVFVPSPHESPLAVHESKPLRLLFVGRLVPYKGAELLLRACAAARNCEWNLDIVGTGDAVYKDYLVGLARELGLNTVTNDSSPVILPSKSAVNFLPPVPRERLPALYQQADVFCFPTLCDTYGIALLEAMSCGCAVLVSDVAGAGEIVNGDNGLKVALNTPEQYIAEFSGQIVALAQNRDFRRKLGEKARQVILREHDWPRIGEQVVEIYRELGDELKMRE